MSPLVSVLIPAYNVEHLIVETIESVLAQTWQNKEIIIVNDGSTDDTLSVARRYESSIVKVIDQENRGQCASENRAFQESQGDFIEYLDADDLLAPDKLERQVKLLGGADSEFIASGEWARFFNSPDESLFIPELVWKSMNPVDWLICSWGDGGMMHGAAWLVPRRVAERAGPWNENLSLINDFEFFSRLLLASKGVKFCAGARTYYRSGHPGRLSASKSRSAMESAILSLELGTGYLLAIEDTPRARNACATVYQRFIYSAYPNALDLLDVAEAKVKELGGTNAKPRGTPLFQIISSMIGWKKATCVQQDLYKLGYDKLAPGRYLARLNRYLKHAKYRATLPYISPPR